MAVHVECPRTNARTNPLGIDTPRPEFAWKLRSDEANVVQTAYAVQVSASDDFEGALAWDSGRVVSELPFGVVYDGIPLESSRRYLWRVRVWTRSGSPSEWSEPASFETAVLDPARWSAEWISGPPPVSKDDDAALYLRGTVELAAGVRRGRAYVSALGWYRLFVNGHDLTASALVPRWTPFDEVLEYQTYDVTEHLRAGRNILAIAVGDGRYRGRLGGFNRRAVYGSCLAAFAQLELELADGSTATVVTDESWHAGPGRIVGSDPKFGERVDLRIPDTDWLGATEPPARFTPARRLPTPTRRLEAEEVERVRDIARLRATVTRSPSGKQLLDFGQNFAGVVRIRLEGPAGTRVRLTHGELLGLDGELDPRNLYLNPKEDWVQRDEVILDGSRSWYQPWFTLHGFRYVEVDGLPHDLDSGDVEGIVLSSELPAAGSFECSDARLEKLHRNGLWSLRSNFTDTPTDCPTRERSGWTADINVFAPTATTLVDAQAFLRRYLRNVALEQFPDGTVPPFIPKEASRDSTRLFRTVQHWVASSVGWGDVTTMLPWTLYRYYGDVRVLERQYESMRRWVDHLEHAARTRRGAARWFGKRAGKLERYVLDTGFHFGEWLRPGEEPPSTFGRNILRPPAVVATAYFAHSASLLARIAAVLGRDAEAQRYAELADKVRAAWRAAFVHEDGRIGDDRQDDYVRALAFHLVTPDQRPATLARLVKLIEAADHHLGTGFLSTPMLLPTLAENGRPDVALRLLSQDSSPSWLHQVKLGATTTWETWQGYDEKGQGRFSHNHYALGAVIGWLQEGLAGLSPAAPGYRHIRIAPVIGGGLTHAAASVDTPFGLARSAWKLANENVELEVLVPPGASAEVHLGDGRVETVGSGRHTFSWRSSYGWDSARKS
jgi:alpha-L-rhamnosidase